MSYIARHSEKGIDKGHIGEVLALKLVGINILPCILFSDGDFNEILFKCKINKRA